MSKRTARLFVYKAKDGWRWRLKSANGKIVAESGEGYRQKPRKETLEALSWSLVAAAEDYEVTP